MSSFQSNIAQWATANFGKSEPWQPYAGLMEEVAEFFAPNWKHTPSARIDAMKDAIGDQCVFVANLCEMLKLDFDDLLLREDAQHFTERELLGALGLGWRALLKHSQGIRGYDDAKRQQELFFALAIWMRWAKWMCKTMFLGEVGKIADDTWAAVSKRDWVAHPADAHSHA